MTASASPASTQPAPAPPPRYKMAVLIWLVIFPSITVLNALLGPYLEPLPVLLRTLITTLILVPIMTYVLLPAVQRLFARWLRAGS